MFLLWPVGVYGVVIMKQFGVIWRKDKLILYIDVRVCSRSGDWYVQIQSNLEWPRPLRDEFQMFMGANVLWFQPITHFSIGEAMSLLSAIKWMHELNFKQVIFSLDSKIVFWFFHLVASIILSGCHSIRLSFSNKKTYVRIHSIKIISCSFDKNK